MAEHGVVLERAWVGVERRQEAPPALTGRGVALLAAAVLALVVLRLPGFRVPMDQDAGCYAYIGETWARGGLPYRDAWDHKPPAIFLLTAALSALPGGGFPVVLRACAVAFGVGTLLLVFGIVRRLGGESLGLAAAFVYAASSSGVLVTRETFQTEHAMALLSVLSVWLLVLADARWRWWLILLAGLSAGAAIAFKPVSAALSGLAFLWFLARQMGGDGRYPGSVVRAHQGALDGPGDGFGRRAATAIGLMAAGVVAVPAAFVAYFAAVGAFDDFWRAFVTYNSLYRAAEEHAGVGLRTTLGLSHVTFTRLRELAPEQAWLVLASLAGLAVVVWGWRRRQATLFLLWPVGALAGLVAAGRFYAYYFLPLSAALAPLAAEGLLALARGVRARPRVWWAVAGAGAIALCFAGGLCWDAREYRALTSPQYDNAILARIARSIRADSRPDDCIFVWGARQQVYVLAERRGPSRFISDAHFRDAKAARGFFGDNVFDEIADAVRAKRCRYVLATDVRALDKFPALKDLLAADYEVVQEVKLGEKMTAHLYRRRAAAERKPT